MRKAHLFLLILFLTFTGALGASAQSCPDDNHPHMIDLGLPSGTKWSCCNVGATTPKDFGGWYSWGETTEKKDYSSYTYQYGNTDIGSNISGTEYDVAYVNSNGIYCMPTYDQLQELYENCQHEMINIDDVKGMLFTHNGASIFLPCGGYNNGTAIQSLNSLGRYWSDKQNSEFNNRADYLVFGENLGVEGGVFMSNQDRYWGHNVRPVVNTSSSDSRQAYYTVNVNEDPITASYFIYVNFYYDNLKDTRSNTYLVPTNGGKLNIPCLTSNDEITITFNSSFADYRPTNTSHWFEGLTLIAGGVEFNNLKNLNTSEVTDMSYMFYQTSASYLDLTHFDTSKATNMSYMLSKMDINAGYDINEINLSSFTFKPNTTTTGLLKDTKIKRLTVPATANNLATDAFSGVASTYYPCTLICPDGFTPNNTTPGNGYFQWKGGYFKIDTREAYYDQVYVYNILDEPDEGIKSNKVTFYYDNLKETRSNPHLLPTNGGQLEISAANTTSITFDSSFAEYRPTNTSSWFKNLYYGYSIIFSGMENLNTSEVTDMSYMFYGINVTTVELDLTHFNTSKATDMSYMLANTSGSRSDGQRSFDLSSFTFKSSTNTAKMLENSTIGALTLPASANYLASDAFLNMNSADDPCTLICPDGFTPQGATQGNGYILWKGGYFKLDTREAYLAYSYKEGTTGYVTLYYDDKLSERINNYDEAIFMVPNNGEPLAMPSSSYGYEHIVISFDPSFADYRPTNTSYWFTDIGRFDHVEFENLEYLNTSKVTNMSHMFANTNLLELDLSHFDTSKVTDMSYMFKSCHLVNLDLSSFTFNPSANFTGMFEGFSVMESLTLPASANYLPNDAFSSIVEREYLEWYVELILPNGTVPQGATQGNGYIQWKGGYFLWDGVLPEAYALVSSDGETMTFYYDEKRNSRTEGTTYLANNKINYDPEWFGIVKTIKKVVFHPSFAYARPTNTSLWFNGMINLTSIEDIKYLNTSEVTHTLSMFKDCKNLKTLDVSKFNTNKVEDMANMFSGCNGLEALDVSNFNTDKVEFFSFMFRNCSSLKTLDVSNFNTDRATDMSGFFAGCSNLETLDVSNFNTDNVMLMPFMFGSCSKLKTLDLSNFNTDKVTNMNYMFNDCSSLESLDLSSFNTENVSDMSRMFYNCKSLETLDLSNFTFNTTKEKTTAMMSNCNNLKLLSIPASANILAANACNEVATEENPCILKYPEEASADLGIPEEYDNFFRWKAGYFTDVYPYAVLSDDNQTLTFYYDDQSNQRSGTVFMLNYGDDAPKWFYSVSSVSLVKFDTSFADARPESTSCWFDNMKYLETIEDIEYLNTEQVTDMASMFSGCSNLKTIDLSNFNTDNVTDMRSMFSNCSSLESLDLSNFNTDNVTSMRSMFSNCSSLESLDLSNFNTANVTDMISMFSNCTSLKSLDLSSFNTAKVTNMVAMFSKCTSMETLDLSNFTFDASNDTYYMMYGCNNLKVLSIPASVNNLEASTCRGVGTEEYPCLLKYPEGASADLGIPEEYDNYFIWKDGYFTDIYLGDANGDDRVTIADVMMTVNKVMKKTVSSFNERNADINNDGNITVADVMGIVKLVLNSGRASAPRNAYQTMSDAMAMTAKGNELTLHLTGTGTYTASQMTLTLPEGCRLEGAQMVSSRSNGHSVLTSDLGNGQYRVVVYGASGMPFGNSCSDLVRLNVKGNHGGDVAVSDIQVVDYLTNTFLLSDVSGIATGIDSIGYDSEDGDWYTTQGQKVATPTRGVYIRNGKKVVVK